MVKLTRKILIYFARYNMAPPMRLIVFLGENVHFYSFFTLYLSWKYKSLGK